MIYPLVIDPKFLKKMPSDDYITLLAFNKIDPEFIRNGTVGISAEKLVQLDSFLKSKKTEKD